MIIHRGYRYKTEPTPEQENQFRQFAGVCRLVYNLALEQRRDWHRQFKRNTGFRFSYIDQARELKSLRSHFDWIAAVSQTCQQQALRDLDKAFAAFFRGTSGFPTPRIKGTHDAFRFLCREVTIKRLNAKWSLVRLPKIGWVKFRDTRQRAGRLLNVTVSHNAVGWHISFTSEIDHTPPINNLPPVGIDRGVANTLALSTGEMLSIPSSLKVLERRHRSAQRTIARRKKGSKRRLKAIQRCAKLSAKSARIRRDWHHKVSRHIANRYGLVALEDLKVSNMTASAAGSIDNPGTNVRQKSGLNRSILNQGWSSFASILKYKLEERGGFIAKTNPAYTSQTCSECGVIDRDNRKNQAVFACQHCGFHAHADHNAAINILRRNTAFMCMEEGNSPSDEVRTRSKTTLAGNPAAYAVGRC